MPSSSASTAPRRNTSSRKKKKKSSGGWLAWWPVLLGILVTPLTIRMAGIFALTGPHAFSYLYPYVLLLKSPALGLSNELGNDLSQLMMYLQFPLYGLLAMLVMRSKGIWAGLMSAVAVHGLAVLALFAISYMHA